MGVSAEAVAEAYDKFERGEVSSPLTAAAISNQTIQAGAAAATVVVAAAATCHRWRRCRCRRAAAGAAAAAAALHL